MEQSRRGEVDIFKRLLIIPVVVGHYDSDIVYDVISPFHMLLFFIISRLLLKREHVVEGIKYIRTKIQNLMIPYSVCLITDLFLIRRDCAVDSTVRALRGGRVVPGVYWYITCFLLSLILLSGLLRKFSDETARRVILIFGGGGAIESHIVEKAYFPQSPGILWNLGVFLITLVYVGVGFFYKDKIKNLLELNSREYDVVAGVTVFGLAMSNWFICRDGNRPYYFDMKPVYYKELLLAVLIPCVFGVVFARPAYWLEREECFEILKRFLYLCGRATTPIVFMYVPPNHWRDYMGYGRLEYMVIGIGISLMIIFALNENSAMCKVLGIPKLNGQLKI